MRDAVKILFDCAMEVRIPSYLTGNEYKNCTLALRREEKHFLSLLPPEEALRLEDQPLRQDYIAFKTHRSIQTEKIVVEFYRPVNIIHNK